MFNQLLMPVGESLILSFVTAALPIATVLVALGVLRRPAWQASLAGLMVGLAIAVGVWKFPIGIALNSVAAGSVFALWPVMWIVFNALLLYNIAVISGRFDAFRDWVLANLPNDRRVVLVVIGFCFGCLLEGISGFGTPVAITSALLILIGLPALEALTFTLIFNTAPVAFGALGTPITVLGQVTDLPAVKLGAMVGRQLPFIAVILPFYVMGIYGGGRSIRALWPVLAVAGISFALAQFVSSNYLDYSLTDVLAALTSLVVTLIFLKVWSPKPDPDFADSAARFDEQRLRVDSRLAGLDPVDPRLGGRDRVDPHEDRGHRRSDDSLAGLAQRSVHYPLQKGVRGELGFPAARHRHCDLARGHHHGRDRRRGTGTICGRGGRNLEAKPPRHLDGGIDRGARLPHELLRHELHAGIGGRLRGDILSDAVRVLGLGRRIPLGQRHLRQRPVRQFASGRGQAAWTESRAHRRGQFIGRRDGKNDIPSKYCHGRVGDSFEGPGGPCARTHLHSQHYSDLVARGHRGSAAVRIRVDDSVTAGTSPAHGTTLPPPDVLDALERRLRRETRGAVLFDSASRSRYATDASIYQIMPAGVFIPGDAADIAAAIAVAGELRVPVLPRGAGTSQCGQTVGAALVIDNSKHCRRVLDIDVDARTATVEPGLVLDDLNQALHPHGLWFPVDVSTSAQATLGGMAGNNSSGSRSIAYGNMVHNVLGMSAWLSDGECVDLGPVSALKGRAATIAKFVRELAARHRSELIKNWPKLLRRVGGYNLDIFDNQSERPYTADGTVNLAHLFVGSEGTLAYTKTLTLKLAPRPSHRVLGVVNFPSFRAAMQAPQRLIELGPCAIELIDRIMIDLGLANDSFRPLLEPALIGRPAAILLVEFAGEDPALSERPARAPG